MHTNSSENAEEIEHIYNIYEIYHYYNEKKLINFTERKTSIYLPIGELN